MKAIRRVSVIVHRGVSIEAPIESVWAAHTNVALWPVWQTGIRRARLEGRLGVGASFRCRLWGRWTEATITALEPQRRIVWRSHSAGVRGLHAWTFEPQPDGTLRVRASVALDGWRIRLLRLLQRRAQERQLEHWLASLKARAEAQPKKGRAGIALGSRQRR